MAENYSILYGILTVFSVIVVILLVIGSVIYTLKKKKIAGLLMIIGSVFQLIMKIASPIITAFAAREGAENVVQYNFITSASLSFFTLIFVIGFVMAMLGIRKKAS